MALNPAQLLVLVLMARGGCRDGCAISREVFVVHVICVSGMYTACNLKLLLLWDGSTFVLDAMLIIMTLSNVDHSVFVSDHSVLNFRFRQQRSFWQKERCCRKRKLSTL